MIEYVTALQNICEYNGVVPFVSKVLTDARFGLWSGSGSDIHHHYGDGGLARHTYEVVEYCQLIAAKHNGDCKMSYDKINFKELLISAVWHDYGKIWDYQENGNGVWGKHNNHARTIHHISRSALEWEKYVESKEWKEEDWKDINLRNITHNILAHHGCREWGSPVAPASREAWVLHLADNISARLDDCYKYDKF